MQMIIVKKIVKFGKKELKGIGGHIKKTLMTR
jgi:hypothetical protein